MEREYPVPGYEGYFAAESGDIISYKRGQRTVLKVHTFKHKGCKQFSVGLYKKKEKNFPC